MSSDLERALQSIKRIGAFSEAEKNALRKAIRRLAFPGDWADGIASANDDDIIRYDAATDEWVPEALSGSTFLSLSDTPGSYQVLQQRFLRETIAGSGLEFVDIRTTDLLDVSTSAKIDGNIFRWSAGNQEWEPSSDLITSVNGNAGVVVLDIDDVTPTTTKGDIIVEDGSNAIRVALGTDTHVLTADSTEPSGVKWAVSPSGFPDPMTTRGDLIYSAAGPTTARLPVGTVGQVLTSDGTDVAWAASVSGVSDFISLNDVPATYVGQADKYVKVNGAADALEFTSVSPVTSVAGTSPLASSGGTTPTISIQEATAAQHGYMSLSYAGKLDLIENQADVTDTANVTAAGAFMGNVTVSSSAPSGGSDGDIWFEVP